MNEHNTISLGRTTVKYADLLSENMYANKWDSNSYDTYSKNAMIIDKDAIINDFISDNFDMTREELIKFIEKYEPERTI